MRSKLCLTPSDVSDAEVGALFTSIDIENSGKIAMKEFSLFVHSAGMSPHLSMPSLLLLPLLDLCDH